VSVLSNILEDAVMVRMYLAAVIGPLRAPFGRRSQVSLVVGEQTQIVSNDTRTKALYVTVTRFDAAANATPATVIFSQNPNGGSTNDNVVAFGAPNRFSFVLKPDESLTMLVTAVGGILGNRLTFVVASEAF
jgi:hypothetical protein